MTATDTEFGFRISVVARSSGEIVDGHLRLKAARRLGLRTVPVVLADELTDAQIRAFRLLANRSATWAGWDDALLALELEDLQLSKFELALTGFDEEEISWLLGDAKDSHDDGQEPTKGEPDASDDVPDAPVHPVSRTGDVWALGQHRLICGDAGDAGVVGASMSEERANLLVTSPLYANQHAYTTGGIADWDRLMQGVFTVAMTVMAAAAQMLAACRTLPLPPAEYATIIAVPGTEVRHVPFHRHRSQDRLPAAAVTRRLVERGSFGAIHCGGDRLA